MLSPDLKDKKNFLQWCIRMMYLLIAVECEGSCSPVVEYHTRHSYRLHVICYVRVAKEQQPTIHAYSAVHCQPRCVFISGTNPSVVTCCQLQLQPTQRLPMVNSRGWLAKQRNIPNRENGFTCHPGSHSGTADHGTNDGLHTYLTMVYRCSARLVWFAMTMTMPRQHPGHGKHMY